MYIEHVLLDFMYIVVCVSVEHDVLLNVKYCNCVYVYIQVMYS